MISHIYIYISRINDIYIYFKQYICMYNLNIYVYMYIICIYIYDIYIYIYDSACPGKKSNYLAFFAFASRRPPLLRSFSTSCACAYRVYSYGCSAHSRSLQQPVAIRFLFLREANARKDAYRWI